LQVKRNLFCIVLFRDAGAEKRNSKSIRTGPQTIHSLRAEKLSGNNAMKEIMRMKRIVTMATAAVFIAAMTSPSLAHVMKRKHSHQKPVATAPVENPKTGKALIPQPPAESLAQKAITPAPTPAVAPTEAKLPTAPALSQPHMTDKMMDKATDTAKEEATDAVTEKATEGMGDAATPSGSSAPSMPGSNSASAMKPLTNPVPGMPK
jgi:hypothetical protein